MRLGILVLCGLLASGVHAREFTGKNGKIIEAEIVSKSPGKVLLKLDGGNEIEVPLSSLSEADQLYVAVWTSPEEKAAKLKAVDLEEALEAQGFLALPVSMVDGRMVVEVSMEGQSVKLMVDHRNEQPILSKATADAKGFKVKPVQGGGQVVGKYKPELVGTDDRGMKLLEFLVAEIENLPAEIDGMIGGQTFVDHSARLDFLGKKLWVKVK